MVNSSFRSMNISTRNNAVPLVFDGFCAAFSTKVDGNMERVHAKREETVSNRNAFLQRIGILSRPMLRVRPSHSPNIEVVSIDGNSLAKNVYLRSPNIVADFDFYDIGADGVLTFDKFAAVSLISGDCIPLLVFDSVSGLHGILHIGLLGALNEMVYGLPPILDGLKVPTGSLSAYLGPSISKRNYDVTRSGLWLAIEDQVKSNPDLRAKVEKHFDGQYFDIRGLVAQQLVNIGVAQENIGVFEECTGDRNSDFFSHYAAKQAGETPKGFCSVIWPI